MKLAVVTGSVTATVKHSIYEGHRLLLMRSTDPEGNPVGHGFVAVDMVQAGPGDRVIYVEEGNSARTVLKDNMAPVRAVIVGIVDRVTREWPKESR